MDGTGPVRPVPGVNLSPAPRNSTEQDSSALPRQQTVTSAERPVESGPRPRRPSSDAPDALPQNERRRNRDEGDKTRRQIEINPETRDVLLKVIDTDTGLVRWQIPAETMMNMRIYAERAAREHDRLDAEIGGTAPHGLEKAV